MKHMPPAVAWVERKTIIMLSKVRLLVLGLLSVMAFGAVASTAALASPGPFWWHRNNSKEGAGVKLAEGKIEQYQGGGNGAIFSSTEGGVAFTLGGETQVKGDIWNEPNQGQMKVQAKFLNVHFIAPAELKECPVKVTVPEDYVGHLMWKYRGQAKELRQDITQTEAGQEWDAILVPAKTVLGKEGLEGKNIFAEIKTGTSTLTCHALANLTIKPKGASGFSDQALPLETFAKKATLTFPGIQYGNTSGMEQQ